jgi:hypothetical protein
MIPEFPLLRLTNVVKTAINRRSPGSFSFPQQHQGRVDCNPGKPRGKACSTFESVKVKKCPHQGFLEHIFCILPIVCYSKDLMQHAPGMALAKFNKGRRVPGPRHSNQHRVVRGIRFLPLGGSIEF